MGDPYTDVTVLNYNDDAPSDDGTEVPSNRVDWALVISEVGGPLKTAIESVNTNVGAAVDKLMGGGGVTSSTAPYTVQASDQGKLVRITSAGTATTATAATVGSPFVHGFLNDSGGTVTLDGAGSETIDGQSSVDFPDGSGAVLFTDGTNWFTSGRGLVQGSESYVTALPRGSIGGLQISNGTDSDHDIDIAVGAARDAADSFNLSITSVLTKQIDASWASGTAAGGMASGVSLDVDTWYHLFLVDLDAGGTDAGFDTSVTAANLLATSGVGTKYRRIGSVLTDASSNIIAFSQNGQHFTWDDPNAHKFLDGATTSVTAANSTLETPLGVKCEALTYVAIDGGAGGVAVYFSDPDQSDVAPTATNGRASFTSQGNTNGAQARVWTNTSSQIRVRSGTASRTINASVLGWFDNLGRFD